MLIKVEVRQVVQFDNLKMRQFENETSKCFEKGIFKFSNCLIFKLEYLCGKITIYEEFC